MIPATFRVLPSFPLNPSGKTDLLALTRMAEEGTEQHEALPDLARTFDEEANLTVNQSLQSDTHEWDVLINETGARTIGWKYSSSSLAASAAARSRAS